jgi:hypothetical protein
MAKKDNTYRQCALKKRDSHHMAWIPTQFANVGKFIKIKQDDGSWDDGWEVMSTGEDFTRTAKEADEGSQLYKKTRRASDI